jgi:hypothetical protein
LKEVKTLGKAMVIIVYEISWVIYVKIGRPKMNVKEHEAAR